MRVRLGTSGFGYEEWAGKFYPKGLPPTERLAYYARRFQATEVNNSFYAMPRPAVLAAWAERVPAGFSFSFKAPGRITHVKRLMDVDEEFERFLDVTAALGPRLGVLVFQLPPSFHKDLDRLDSFLGLLPARRRFAFEFRHPSWFSDDVLGRLERRDAALCFNDADVAACPLIETAPWGMLKLRRVEYTHAQLASVARRLQERAWKEAFVFFKHEETASAPRLALRLEKLLAGESQLAHVPGS